MHNGKHILAVVPARGGSKGIKNKNLREVRGIPLVGWVGKVLADLPAVDRAVVSTDSPAIAECAERYGIAAPFYRPESISGDRIGDLDVLVHALNECEKLDNARYDVVVMLQPTSPLRRAEHVRACYEKLDAELLDSVWTVSETDSKAHPYKQLTIREGRLGYWDPENGPRIIARQQLGKLYHRNGVAYAITRECLLEQKTIFGRKAAAIVIDEPLANIDVELDLEWAAFLMEKAGFA